MPEEILFRERYGAFGQESVYIKPRDKNSILRLGSAAALPTTVSRALINAFRQVFLPQGYPESVSNDYHDYQIWDTVQAFCSTISGALTTQAIMKGVGVGDTVATPFGAAVMWILKDGTGMVGRIAFAWWKGSYLDADCKKWRLFADGLNDIAMCMELLLPYYLDYSTQMLCFSTSMKAIVGVAGGATRAAITQHQAVRENMADVSAKDGSQETFVNLAASMIGILILSFCVKEEFVWCFFLSFTACHLYANYKAVKSLKLISLNSSRLLLLLQNYLTNEIIKSPEFVNKQESVLVGMGLTDKDVCGHHIVLGASLKRILSSGVVSAEDMKYLAKLYRNRKHLFIIDYKNKTIYVALQKSVLPADVIEAYFHAILLGITTSIFGGFNLQAIQQSDFQGISCSLSRLQNSLNKHKSMSSKETMQTPLEAIQITDVVASTEFSNFLPAIQAKGWSVRSHHLPVNEWRGEW